MEAAHHDRESAGPRLSRVLLVCPEPLGHRQPAGIGIRFVEMAVALRADGHAVSVLSPDGGSLDGCLCGAISPGNLRDFSSRSDVIVVQGHAANEVFAHAQRIPTVVDLYDPFIIENLHYFTERGGEVFDHDHATLLNSLANGDFFLCASDAQRLFYLGAMIAAGRLNPMAFETDPHLDQLLRVAPFGVQPPRLHVERDLTRPAILFGGIYDWYDPILAIDAVAIVRHTLPGTTLTFTRHPNPGLTPQGKTAEAIAYSRSKKYEFVEFVPWTPYDHRGEFFDRHALALLTFPQSIETDLSMRTRVYDYLWGALPIVTSSAPGTDEIITRYGTGVVVHHDSAEAFAGAIVSILSERVRHGAMVSAARVFVEDHQWPQSLAPLLEFCRAPRVDPSKERFSARLQVPEHPPSILTRLKRRMGGRS
jgi:glycosyltransferase involved in cell wall biosynthesis